MKNKYFLLSLSLIFSFSAAAQIFPFKRDAEPDVLINHAASYGLIGLFAIQKLASKNIPVAEDISKLYGGYKDFLVHHDKEKLLTIIEEILEQSKSNLGKESALYVKENLLGGLQDGKSHLPINKLLPFLGKSLTTPPPKIIYPEEKVLIPEMQASHHAFPDMIKFQNAYYIAFREGESHVGHKDFGKIRILKGQYLSDQKKWDFKPEALLFSPDFDFRDPKFFIDGNQALRLIMGGSLINEKGKTILKVPHAAIKSKDGSWAVEKAKVDPLATGKKGQWIWRVTWNPYDNKGYAFSYTKDKGIYFMQTEDGVLFKKIGYIPSQKNQELNEATIRFKKDGTAIALIRATNSSFIAKAHLLTNETDWVITAEIPFTSGGPNFIVSEKDGKMWAAARHIFAKEDGKPDFATVVLSMTENELIPVLRLKSNGDTSYPGMVEEEDGSIWIVYYSTDQDNKSHIYITKILMNNN